MTTIETLTTKQIKALRAEAIAAGDYRQADICDRALATDAVDQDGNEIALADWTVEQARAAIVEAINDAEAQA